MSDSESSADEDLSNFKNFLIVEEEGGADVIETSLISSSWVIRYNKGESVNEYWYPTAQSQNQYFDARVTPQTACITVEEGRQLQLTWSKQIFKRIVYQSDDFRKAKQSWRLLSDAESPEMQSKRKKGKKQKEPLCPQYERVGSEVIRQKVGIPPPSILSSKGGRSSKDGRLSKRKDDVKERPTSTPVLQEHVSYKGEGIVMPSSSYHDTQQLSSYHDTPVPIEDERERVDSQVSGEKCGINQSSSDHDTRVVSIENERRFSPRLRERTGQTLVGTSSSPSSLSQKRRKLNFGHSNNEETGSKNKKEAPDLEIKIGSLLRGQRRMEATLALILQKQNVIEERLDALVKAGGIIEGDDAEDEFEGSVLFPIRKETDFMAINSRLNNDVTFRNKFLLHLKKVRRANNNNPDKKIAMEMILEHFLGSEITDFGTWSGVRWKIEDGKKLQYSVFAFDSAKIFKILLDEAGSLLNNKTEAQHVVQEWLRNRAAWRKKNVDNPTKKRKIALRTRKPRTKMVTEEDENRSIANEETGTH